jgi:hypothetical protein
MKRCAACGQDNDDWRPFCTRCGASYTASPAEAALDTGAPGVPRIAPLSGEPGFAAPAGTRRRPSTGLIALSAVVAVAVGVGAFVGLSGLGSSSHHAASTTTTTFPATWDPRVADLVHFDSGQRSLGYTHPVKVVFLSEAAFKKRVTNDGKLTAKDRRDLQTALAELRAMGMVQGNPDLLAESNQLSGATTLAYYDDTKKEVVVPGSTLDVEERVTLAHELTHTLDDEHFDLAKLNRIGSQHDTDAVTALIEGDAVWVQNKYVATLSPADHLAYERSQNTAVSPGALNGVPKIFEILDEWPYDFGPLFVDILNAEGGEAKVDAAFGSPPIDEAQVIDPISYLQGDQPAPISQPVLPRGAKKLDSGKEFGALAWFLVLSERIDPHVALKAALGWGADAYTEEQQGSKTCIEIHYRGETRHANADMLSALHQWIAALPNGMATVTANQDNTLLLESCDPGAAAKTVTNRSVAAYELLLFRDTLIDEFVRAGADPEVATCVSDAVTAQSSVADIDAGKTPAVLTDVAAIRQIAATCRATAGTTAADEIDQ